MPAIRTILAYFFIYSLFNKIQTYAERQGYSHKNSPLMMCIGFTASSLLSSLPDPYWLISLFNFVFLIPAFQALNYAKLNSQGLYTVQMKKFSLPQKFLVAFGIVFQILMLMALFILETPQQTFAYCGALIIGHAIKLKFGGVSKSMLTLNEAIIDVKEG